MPDENKKEYRIEVPVQRFVTLFIRGDQEALLLLEKELASIDELNGHKFPLLYELYVQLPMST